MHDIYTLYSDQPKSMETQGGETAPLAAAIWAAAWIANMCSSTLPVFVSVLGGRRNVKNCTLVA